MLRRTAILIVSCVLMACEDSGCNELSIEIAAAAGTRITRLALVTPDSAHSDNVPSAARTDQGVDYYVFTTLASYRDRDRKFIVETADQLSSVFVLPPGRVAPSPFSNWLAPEFISQSRDVVWEVMDAHPLKRGRTPVRLRYRFAWSEICDDE